MTHIPEEIVDVIQDQLTERLDELWHELLICAQKHRDSKECRRLLNKIDELCNYGLKI